ncbi:MAG: YqaA family protein [Candidatus Alcyoniella australis]|nr:YqaA family protein [Candidatus Alcyoniella australis]
MVGRSDVASQELKQTIEGNLAPGPPQKRGLMRRLYDWVLHWAETPYGSWALGLLAVAESSFFPIPPDPLLIVLVLGKRSKAMFFAALTTLGSVIGGVGGWLIGMFLMQAVGQSIIDFYGAQEQFNYVEKMYNEWGVIFLFTAALTPIPYKVFTIASGAFGMSLLPFVLISLIGRGLRFFAVSGLIYLFGPPIQRFIDKYFNLLAILFVVLLVAGFVLIKYFFH